MVQRLTLRRRLSYNTRSNRRKIVKTPGGKLVYLYPKKPGALTKCADTKKPLAGLRKSRRKELRQRTKREKHVSRSFGGCLSGKALRNRILRAFLIEEQRIVVRVLKAQKAAESKPKK